MTPTFSCAILHAPWKDERRTLALAEMRKSLHWGDPETCDAASLAVICDRMPEDVDWHDFKCRLALRQWEWALHDTHASHHIFLTDDLHLAPDFWEILRAMVTAKPASIIGLLSNHPRGPELYAAGEAWYRCNSWVVGPAYVVPRVHLEPFVAWYRALPDDGEAQHRRWFNDDSALNEWNTFHGPGESWHPLPTPIEHRGDLGSTVGHGDQYSRERVSWRETRGVTLDAVGDLVWGVSPLPERRIGALSPYTYSEYWDREGPMLPVGG